MSCPVCGSVAPDGALFCPRCGHQLSARSEERRVATVLFADLVGFTGLSEIRDPEHVKRLVDQCFEALARDIRAYGGVVDKLIGDAIVALFGAPVAHEDDAERAVRAALAMQQTLAADRSRLGTDVQMRIGVNTGEVVVGALRAGGDYTAMGDAVNIASRLQSAAPPGGVLVGPATHAATAEGIRYEPVGLLEARGRVEPVEAWLATGSAAPPGYRRRRRTPLIGRDEELGMLQHALNSAIEHRRAHLILLVGEAGVGKTRLAQELAESAAATHDAVVLEGRCVPYGEANVWWPVAEALRQALGVDATTGPEVARRAATSAVAAASGLPDDHAETQRIVVGLLHLLGLDGPLSDIDPQRAREEANRAVLGFVEASAAQRPVVVVLSDLHWADEVVLEMIDTLIDKLSRGRVIVVATARAELHERWSSRAGRHNLMVLNLDPLDRDATRVLLDELVDEDLPREAVELLLDHSGGNPFFLEELVALVAETEAVPTGWHDHRGFSSLPDTLRGLVAARLDALEPPLRRVLEDASVWGRSGRIEVLERMGAGDGRHQIDGAIRDLCDKELLVVDGDQWRFRSDLVRDIAYGTLTKADRARTHYGIGKFLEAHGGEPARADDWVVDVVANHFATAGSITQELGGLPGVADDVAERALVWVGEAASRAHAAQALPVSINLFGLALGLIGDEVSERRVDLLLGRGLARAEQRRLDDARIDVELAERLATDLEYLGGLARASFLRGTISQHTGDLAGAVELFSRALAMFEQVGDQKGEADALRAIGMAQIFQGANEDAESSISDALEISRQLGDRRGEAWALQQMAWISFVRGYTAEADERLTRAGAGFEELGDSGGLAWVRGLLAYVRMQQGDLAEAGRLGEEVLEEARRRGDRWAEGMMLVLGAAVKLWSGHALQAIPLGEEALSRFREIDDRYGEAQALAFLGRALVMGGRVSDGFRALEAQASLVLMFGEEHLDDFVSTGTATAAVQVGDVRRAGVVAWSIPSGRVGVDSVASADRLVASGLFELQRGDVGAALELLELAVDRGDDEGGAYARSSLALARAARGELDEVLELESAVCAMRRATYLDRAAAAIAAGLALAARGKDEGADRLMTAVAEVDCTDDLLTQAVARLAAATGLEALAHPEADAFRGQAEDRLGDLGIEALGWRRAFDAIVQAEGSGTTRR